MSRLRRGWDADTLAPIQLEGLARLEMREEGPATVARITGEVDVSNAGALSQALTGVPNATAGLIIDLSATSYLDSAAISLMHELASRLDRRAQRLILVCPSEAPCRRVLELTGLGLTAPIVDELPAAVRELVG